jgi:hypothetical protein
MDVYFFLSMGYPYLWAFKPNEMSEENLVRDEAQCLVALLLESVPDKIHYVKLHKSGKV